MLGLPLTGMYKMRSVMWVLVILLLILQYHLWFGQGGYSQAWKLRKQLEKQAQENTELQQRNAILTAEVLDLKQGRQAVEEHARNDLGMVKNDETFYQVVHANKNKS